MEYRKTLNTM